MKEEFLGFICCPICKGVLELTIKEKKDTEILEGALVCPKCNIKYVITRGIPNLLPP